MKVLLATDGSKSAEAAAALFARLPHSERIELTVIAVNPVIQIYGPNRVVEWIKRAAESEKELATNVCRRIGKMFEGANASVDIVVAEGHPGSSIVSEAKSRGCDLIVLGAIGHSVVDRVLVGSVSDFVATHAHCSVLLVRPKEQAELNAEHLKLCIAYDDSQPSKVAIQNILKFKWGDTTHVDLFHAVAIPYSYSEIPIAYDIEPIMDAMKTVLGDASRDLQGQFGSVIPYVVQASHVGDAIVDFSKKHHTDILVLGDTGHGLLSRFLLGSVSRFVLRHARCSVWISRKPTAQV
jgi:nucleotide-binding universal stress UspA family protein